MEVFPHETYECDGYYKRLFWHAGRVEMFMLKKSLFVRHTQLDSFPEFPIIAQVLPPLESGLTWLVDCEDKSPLSERVTRD